MKQRVYIETSIPSFYWEKRQEPDMLARRNWTVTWWKDSSPNYEIVTSVAVLDELREGDYETMADCLKLMENVALLPVVPEIADIVATYLQHHVMSKDPTGDALHLAISSYHKCDFLLTWNCNHLANANKFSHIRQVNGLLGLYTPSIVWTFALFLPLVHSHLMASLR